MKNGHAYPQFCGYEGNKVQYERIGQKMIAGLSDDGHSALDMDTTYVLFCSVLFAV